MKEVEAYLATLPDDRRAALEHVRTIVRTAVPDTTEAISYGMPALKYRGKYLCGYFAFKQHLSFFPSGRDFGELEEQLKPFRTSKGTLQFQPNAMIPDDLIRAMINVSVKDIDASAA